MKLEFAITSKGEKYTSDAISSQLTSLPNEAIDCIKS
jgi:hypothetical protein